MHGPLLCLDHGILAVLHLRQVGKNPGMVSLYLRREGGVES